MPHRSSSKRLNHCSCEGKMVGTTGFEPVTPTMSRLFPYPKGLQSLAFFSERAEGAGSASLRPSPVSGTANLRALPTFAAAAVLALALAGCEQQSTSFDRPIIQKVYRSPSDEMDVWRDRDTGCWYISYTSSSGLTPRLGKDGKPICGFSDTSVQPDGGSVPSVCGRG